MIDYVNNFPIVPETPQTPRLTLQAYTSDPQFLMGYQGDLKIPDVSRKFDPAAWVPSYDDVIERDTYNEYLANNNLLSSLSGGQQGIANQIAEWFGYGPNEFQDYSKGAAMRAAIMGRNPLAVVKYGDSDLTPEKLDKARGLVKLLAPIADQEEQNPNALTPTQQRLQKAEELLQYALARKTVKENLGFSTKEGLLAQSTFYGALLGKSDLDIARGVDDILAIRNKVDLSFDPELWWEALDPKVKQGFLENNITPNLIYTATNEDEANYRINEILVKSNVQSRIEQYKPRWVDTGRMMFDNLVGGVINSPDTIPFAALELGATVATGGLSLIPSVAAATATTATTGLTAFRAVRNVAETIAKLPLGMAPSYAKNLGMLNSAVMTGGIFGIGSALQETARQDKLIAYSAALNYADPESQSDFDIANIAWAGGEGFALGFVGFGLLPTVTGSTAGAFLNRLKGVNVAPVGEAVVRMSGDRRFTFEGTRLGETLGYFDKKLTRKEVAVDLPVPEKVITETILEGVEPTAERIQAETTTARDRTDARAAVTPEAARATPDVPMARRLDNETRQAYAERTGTNGTLSNIMEFVTELSRKNSASAAAKEHASFTGTADTFKDMGTTDRLRVLHAAEEHLATTRLKEKAAGKLTPARDKIYATMETQRRGMIKQFTKSLSKPERKALSASLEGVKVSPKTVAENLAEARSTVISSAAKNEAAEKAAVSLLGTVREIVANPSKKAQLSADLPKEVLDAVESAITELALTNTISESTVDAIKADVSGVAQKPSNKLNANIREALKTKKLNPKRTALINALREDLSKFSSLVSGNKANAERFYQFTNELVDGGYINAIDQSILLASVVHLNFDSKVFGLKFEIDSIVNKTTGKIEYTTIGAFNDVTKAITINSSWIGNSSERRVLTVLHEIGHAYFQSSATSDIYLDTLKMYNSLTRNYGPSLLNLNMATVTDPLLSSGYLKEYHLQNMEEVFVHTFSQVLFTESQLAIAQLAPIEVSAFRSILNDMKKGIILAAAMFNSSDHYSVANSLITRITEIDMATSRAISVPDLAEAMAQAAKNKSDNFTYDSFNSMVRDWIIKNKPNYANSVVERAKLTKGEFKLLFEVRQDPSLIVAMALLKSNGRQAVDAQGNLTIHMKDLVDAYSSYKQTQFGSMLVKTAWLLTTQEYKQMGNMNKRRRLGFIQEKLFDIETKEFKQGSYATPILPATYEDRHLALVESTNYLDPSKSPILYAFNFWGTRADSLILILNNPNKLNETAANKKNILSETDRLALIDKAMNDPYLNQPLIRTLQEYYKNHGFADIAHLVTLAHHKHYIDTLKTEGVFDNEVLDRVYLEQVVQTPEFKKFFGDSKAVDANGKPIIVYHGTTTLTDFNEFKLGGGIYGSGIYTSTNTDTANVYALVNPRRPNIPTGARIFPLFISISKPLVLDFSKTGMKSIEVILTGLLTKNKLTKALDSFTSAVKAADEAQKTKLTEAIDLFAVADQTKITPIKTRDQAIADAVEALGYDGFKVIMNAEDTYWIALRPEQVKSVYNEGTFSKLTPDIRRDMDLPLWSSKEIAIDSIAAFLSNKDITHLSVSTLRHNINPVLIQKLLDSPDMTPEKALAGIHKMIETEAIVLNKTSGKWELPSTKKPKGPSKAAKAAKTPKAKKAVAVKEAKVKKEAKLAALEDYSEELTLDNIEDVFSKFSYFKTLTEEQINNLYDKLPYIKSKIESGGLKTEKDLLKLAVTINQNILLDDIRKARRAGSLETEEGITQEGEAPKRRDGKFVPPTEKQYRAVIFENALLWNSLTNNTLLTEKEVLLAKGLLVVESDDALSAKALELLGQVRSASSIRDDRTALRKKMAAIAQAIEYEATDRSVSIQDSLLAYVKQTQQTVDNAVTKPTPVKAIVKQAEDAPAAKPVSTPVAAGSRLLENQALAAKLKKKDPAPVITPVTKVEEGTLFRATSEATGNAPETVLRPEKQVDAIIENSDVSTKEAVSFVPKKPLVMTVTSAEFMANPVKMASTLKVADRMSIDALVFSDGVMMPLKVDAPVVTGVVETKVKPGVESVTKVTVTKGVPKKTVTAVVKPSKSKAVVEKPIEVAQPEVPTTPVAPTTVTEVAPKPAPTPKVDPISAPVPTAVREGAPVKVTKTGKIEGPAPVKTVSEVVKTTETERIERVVNDDKDLLRDNGMDQGFLKLFLKNYWTRMQNIDKSTDTYSPMLLSLWTKFVTINKAIVEANRVVFGDDGVAKFWIVVDKLRAENIQKLATIPGYKPVSERQLMVLAAKEVGDAYMPPILLDELNIVKTSEDASAFTLVAKESKTPRKKVSDATKEESPVPKPPEPTPAPAPKAGEEAAPVKPEAIPLEPLKKTPAGKQGKLIDDATSNSEENASVLLRQSNFIGVIFGGSERAARNWWRSLNSWMANTTQTASQTGKTIRSLQKNIRFLSRLFEDNRAQTGHLTAAGKEAFRTARQCKSDEARMITRIARQQLLVNKRLRDSGLAADKVRAVGILSYTKLSEGTNVTPADLVALGLSPELAKEVATETNVLLKVTRQTNQTVLDLQADTGLGHVLAADGTPLDPMTYAPVQLNHESFGAMSPADRSAFVAALVKSRRARKLKTPILDINTIIVLGWLDVASSKEARGTALFAGDRAYRPGDTLNSLSPETLAGLKVSEHPLTIGPKDILAELANGADSQIYFVLTADDGSHTLYRMPKVINDLSEADQLRYTEAVNGNKSLYTQRWQDYLKGRDLIEVEMNEMLDFKTKKGAYGEHNRKTGTNIDRPLMRVGQEEQTALAVPGLIPEEVLSDPVILKHIRTNLAESYNYFLNGRVFELVFQKELDRLMGTRGVTMEDVFSHIAVKAREDVDALAKAENWSQGQTEARQSDITVGIQRLKDEYMYNADTLPMLPHQDQYAARISLALLKVKVAPGYFLGALPELIMETLKANPLSLPRVLIQNLRYLAGDLRFSKNAFLNNSELGDMIFGLENIKHDFSSRFLGEAGQGAFELDSKLKTKFINSNPSRGVADTGVRGLEVVSKVAESIGSLQAITNMTRAMAKTRIQRMLYKHIKKGRIQKLLTALEDPKLMKVMQDYMVAAETDAAAERKLWKQFSTIARQNGFGFNPQEALVFLKYGLNSPEKIRHLDYLIKAVDPKGDGRVNIHNMVDVYWNTKSNPVAGIKPEVLEQVISSYGHALDDLVVKYSSPEPTGLGRVTSIDSKTPLGKLWYALSSYMRGFQDSVILDYGSRSTLHYLAANIVLYGTIDTLIGLFREWVAGREGEDIVEEFSENPAAFAVRVAKSSPILGTSQAALEQVLSGLSYMSGGTWKSYGSPMESIGIGAAASAGKDIARGVSGILEGTTEEDYMKVAKGVGDITSVNSLLNRSPFAVAARSLEASGSLDQKGALQSYLDVVQRDPYPYAKLKRQQKSTPTLPTMPQVKPRNYILEEQAIEKARLKKAGIPYKDMSKGVSGPLGDLLDNAQ